MLGSGRMVENEQEESKDEQNEPPKNPNPYSATSPLVTAYKPKAPLPQHLRKPIEKMEVKLNIFNVTQHPPSENECFFLDIIKEFVEDSLPSILTKCHF